MAARCTVLLTLLTTLTLDATIVRSRALEDPAQTRLKFFLRIMAFDHGLPTAAPTLRIGLLVPKRDTTVESYRALQELFASNEGARVKGKPFEVVELAYTRPQEIADLAARAQLHALFVTGTVPAIDVAAIVDAATREQLLTFSEATDLVVLGIGASVELVDDRPRILVNPNATRAAGHELDQTLLSVAHIIR